MKEQHLKARPVLRPRGWNKEKSIKKAIMKRKSEHVNHIITGVGINPETMESEKYDLGNMRLCDIAGFGERGGRNQ